MSITILADQSLPGLQEAFPAPFVLSLYAHASELPSLLPGKDILLCRSTLKVNESLLQSTALKYVATASSGRDHIDEEYLKKRKIYLLDAKGSNASSVADYVLSSLAYLFLNKAFNGKKAGIIGCGAVGQQVMKRLKATGFEVLAYDPPREAREKGFLSASMEDLVDSDVLCIHANLHRHAPFPSYNLLDGSFLKRLKSGTVIINAARGDIINEKDLLGLTKPLYYCTDVYSHEPAINPAIIDFATLCTPHIAGHSLEAKTAAIQMISQQIHEAYRLTPPVFKKASKLPLPHKGLSSWQSLVLSLYNPLEESLLLKAANDKKNAFIDLRLAHQYRHDFEVYDFQIP